ncbi:lanosterol 14-alpha demethylase [Aspergillus udagawae]|nr:lanosterol 14-alpha demethylase [Aspergillus udagawae]
MTRKLMFSTYPDLLIALVLGAVFLISAALILGPLKIPPSIPREIPRVRRRRGISSGLWTWLRGWVSARPLLSEGYDKFNRHGRLFSYANGNLRPQVILSVKDFEWMLRQPDSFLSQREVVTHTLQLKSLYPSIFPNGLCPQVAKVSSIVASQFLTQKLDRIQPELADELRRNIDHEFGKDYNNWQPVNLAEAIQRVALGMSSRLSWGLPLGRDATFMRSLSGFISLQAGAIIVCGQLTPWFLQPLLGAFFRVLLYFAQRRLWIATEPLIKEWLAQVELEEQEQVSDKNSRVPYNIATSFIRESRRIYGSNGLNKEKLLMAINLFTIIPFMSTISTSSAAILDIASFPPEKELYQQLRQEAAKVLGSEEEWTDPISFKRLHYTDSAIRESLRLTPVSLHASSREVIPPSGITLPAGQHLPQGIWLAASTLDIHTDERFYPKGQSYEPFRFVEEQTIEDCMSPSNESNKKDTSTAEQMVTKVAVTPTYLPFGAGRHACPGRHFALHLLKMIVAYTILNYDIEPLDKRPENVAYGHHLIVPPSATVRVRRREVN